MKNHGLNNHNLRDYYIIGAIFNKNIMGKKISCLLLLFLICFSSAYAVDYNVLNYGAKGDGVTLDTKALQATIDLCSKEGGGRVVLPRGIYLSGTINLKSGVELHLDNGSEIRATLDLDEYQQHNDSLAGLFYTEDAQNVAITGNGLINGRGMEFMTDIPKTIFGPVLNDIRQGKNFRKVQDGGLGDGPVYPKSRFHQMIIFSNCKNVRLTDFHVKDAPYWTFLIVHCHDVWVEGLNIDNNLLIPNSDGLDIDSSSDVNVSDCIIRCGDDAITLTGYAHHFGDPGFKDIMEPSRNINISNCVLQSRSAGIRIGGWDQNEMMDYNFSNISIYDSNRGILISLGDYAGLTNCNFNNINIHTRLHTGDWWGNGEPIRISAMKGVEGHPVGKVRNVHFNNINCNGESSIVLWATDESLIENVSFTGFSFVLKESKLEDIEGGNFDLRPTLEPHKEIFKHDIPIVFIHNAKNIFFRDGTMKFEGKRHSYHTRGLETEKVTGLHIENISCEGMEL